MTPALVILAGGRATRLGGQDKALLPFGATTLLDRVLQRLAPTGPCAISANGDPTRFARFGLPVLPDPFPEFPGPLAGILAGMTWATGQADDIVTVPVDGPFVPLDLIARLRATRGNADIACAMSKERLHPVYALWPVRLAPELRASLLAGERKVAAWQARFRLTTVEFGAEGIDPFLNINSEEDLRKARALPWTRKRAAPF